MRVSPSVNTSVALAAFISTCAILHALLPQPLPQLGYVNSKLRFLAAHRDDYDTIFIGSSRTFRGVSPAVFDRTSAAAGQPHRSFNFGIDAMWPPEQFYILDALLQLRPRTWRWVLIELDDVQTHVRPELRNAERTVYWHDAERTALVFRKLLQVDEQRSIPRSFRRGWRQRTAVALHAGLFLRNMANLGRANTIFRAWNTADDAADRSDYLGPDGDGHIGVDIRLSGNRADAYEQSLRREESQPRIHLLDAVADKAYRSYAARFAKLGMTTAFFVTPGSPSQLPSRFARQPAPTLFTFNDPAKYPTLYDAGARWDDNHLNAIGSVRFSQIFADAFVAAMQR